MSLDSKRCRCAAVLDFHPRTRRPVVEARYFSAKPRLEQIAVLAKIMQQSGERCFICSTMSFEEVSRQ